MGRISKEQKNDVRYYAGRKDIDLRIADILNTRDEVDAVEDCMFHIKQNKDEYTHAVGTAPHDAVRTRKALNKQLAKAKNLQQHDDILQEWKAVSPWYSDSKKIKNDVLDECRIILKNAGIGGNRIEQIIPLLTWHLLYNHELLTEVDQSFLDLIESF